MGDRRFERSPPTRHGHEGFGVSHHAGCALGTYGDTCELTKTLELDQIYGVSPIFLIETRESSKWP